MNPVDCPAFTLTPGEVSEVSNGVQQAFGLKISPWVTGLHVRIAFPLAYSRVVPSSLLTTVRAQGNAKLRPPTAGEHTELILRDDPRKSNFVAFRA